MSLSNHGHDSNLTGKVVIGMDSPGPDEMSIQELEGKRQLLWDETTNEDYLNRVKEKAKEKAKEILMLAELEAEALRASARHEGFEAGMAEAQEQVDQHIQAVSSEVEGLMSQIGTQGATIFNERRRDIMALIKLAVEKTIHVELSENRVASLENLLEEALERIESQREITIKCFPEDAADLQGFMQTIQDRNPALKYWKVKGDPAVQQGGVVLEGSDAKVDNTIASRWQGVEPILDQLTARITAPEDEG